MDTPDILKKIIASKHRQVAAARDRVPLSVLEQRAARPRNRRGFARALSRPGEKDVQIIAEIKRASPSAGPILPDADARAMARFYESGKAAALSVLTDEEFFRARSDDLALARAACSLPVLRKEFIVDEYQVFETAVMGADALLLIAAAVDDGFLSRALGLCRDLGLDALVEVHDEAELDRVQALGHGLVGINNRNLSTFVTDIQTTVRLSESLAPDAVAVCESGIRTRQDVETIAAAGVFNFLIGETLVRAPDPGRMLGSLMGKQGES